MSDRARPSSIRRSGPFELDVERATLTRRGVRVEVSGRPLRILEMLLAEPGRVVTREALQAALWPEATRIDTGRRLNTAMRALREALGDGAAEPRFIETIRGRGYRWIADSAARTARRAWLRPAAVAASVAAGLFLGAPNALNTIQAEAPQANADYVRILARLAHEPSRAVAALDAFTERRPRHAAAHRLRAELGVRAWTERPTAPNLAAARTALRQARAAIGADAALDALAADLALAADWNWTAAERLYRAALARDPDNARARRGLAWLLVNAGRENAAWPHIEAMLSTASLSPDMRAELGWLLLRMNLPDLAAEICAETGEPHLNRSSCLHTALQRSGRISQARDVAVSLLVRLSADPALVASVRDDDAAAGYQRFLNWRTSRYASETGHWFQRAQLFAEAGDADAALDSLERAFTAREPAMVKIASTREFASLSAAPRFQEMVRAVHAR